MTRYVFITGTGTGVGKTVVSVGLTRHLHRQGKDICALKPIETGCAPEAEDALYLANACNHPELADAPGFYRAQAALAPFSVELEGGPALPSIAALAESVRKASKGHEICVIEGAGGPLVPLSTSSVVIDLARELDAAVIVVALDRLGTLSHTFTALESLRARDLKVLAIALNACSENDSSQRSNQKVLEIHTELPVFRIARIQHPERADVCAAAIQESRLSSLVSN